MYLITDESCRPDKVTCITEVRIAAEHAYMLKIIYLHGFVCISCTHTCIYRIDTYVYSVLYNKSFEISVALVRMYMHALRICMHSSYICIHIHEL